MIDYELAQKLKEAGFPFTRIEAGMCCNKKDAIDFNPSGDSKIGAQHFFLPTLSELIEACGNRNNGDITVKGIGLSDWIAIWHEGFEEWEGRGSTPEEAVANLYLELKLIENERRI